jgi:membrane protease YdiL (CAAX protease family)
LEKILKKAIVQYIHFKYFTLFALLLNTFIVLAQDNKLSDDLITVENKNKSDLSRNEVLLIGGLPYMGTLAMSLAYGLLPEPYGSYTAAGIIAFGNIPHIILDPLDGFVSTGLTATAYGASIGFTFLPDLYGDRTLNSILQHFGLNTSFWSYYEGYARARKRTNIENYSNIYSPSNLNDLITSPWNAKNIGKIYVWLPTILALAGNIGLQYIETNGVPNAVWNTGRAFIGNKEVPIAVGLISTFALSTFTYTMVAIGEESLYRGFGYEEMKINIGSIPAKIMDPIIFSSIHVGQEIKAEIPLSSILLHFTFRSLVTIGLDWAYDNGGIGASIAQHMWFNTFASTAHYLLNAGIPGSILSIGIDF